MSLCLVTMFKNEAHIIKEWIEHYLKQGVDKFFMIDNDSNDNYLDFLKPYIEKNIVDLVIDTKKHAQIELYNKHYLEKSKGYDWVMVVDLDEFIYARNGFHTIKEYLSTIDNKVSQIFIPWKIFGSNGNVTQPECVIKNFTMRINYDKKDGFQGVIKERDEIYSFTKTIVRTKFLISFGIHNHKTNVKKYITSDGQCDSIHNNVSFAKINENILKQSNLHLNHYAIQSYSWFMKIKSTRGDSATASSDFVRDEKYFRQFDAVSNNILDLELCKQ